MNTLRLIFMLLLLSGCEGPLVNQNQNPVKLLDNGNFIYDFKYADYCREIVDAKICALETIKQNNLTPSNCKNLQVLKAGWSQNGGGWAEFHCEEK